MRSTLRRWLAPIALGGLTAYLIAIVALGRPEASIDALLLGRQGFGLTFATWIGVQLVALVTRARGWSRARAALRAHPDRVALAAIGLLAAALRLAGLSSNGAVDPGVDEARYVAEAVRMIERNTLDHRNLEHGGLPYYVQALASMAYGVIGPMQGLGGSLAELPRVGHLRYGRAAIAIVGTATVLALGWAVRPLARGTAAPLLAALLLALDAAHLAAGAEIHDDLHAALWVTLAWGAMLRIPRRRVSDLGAGVLAGLAVAAKYYDLVVVLPLALVILGDAGRRGEACAPRLGRALAGVALGFFLGSPFTVLHPGEFLAQTKDLHLNTFSSETGAALAPHLVSSVVLGLGPVLAAVLAIACVARGAAPGAGTVISASFPLAFVALLANFDRIYARYLIPLHPYLCWGVAAALADAVGLAESRLAATRARAIRLGVAAVAVAGVAAALPGVVEVVRARFEVSPTGAVERWMSAHLGPGARVLSEVPLSAGLDAAQLDVVEVALASTAGIEKLRAAGIDYVLIQQRNFERRGLRRGYARLVRDLALVKTFPGGAGPPANPMRIYSTRGFPLKLAPEAVAGSWRVRAGALPPGSYDVTVAVDAPHGAVEMEVVRVGAEPAPPRALSGMNADSPALHGAFELAELATVEVWLRPPAAREPGGVAGPVPREVVIGRAPDPEDPVFQPRHREPRGGSGR